MRDVSVVGIGQTQVKEHWSKSLRELATEAILGAMKDGHVDHADAGGQAAIYVGNTLPQRGGERGMRNNQNASHVSVTAKNGLRTGERAL